MSGIAFRLGFLGAGLAAALALTACSSSKSPSRVPVEDRGALANRPVSVSAAPEVKPLPGAENAGKPGYYTVRRGDTVMRIGLETGQAWRDIVRWNGIENPNLIEVGQVLRVVAPVGPFPAPAAPALGHAAVVAPAPAPAPAPVALDGSGGAVTRPVTSGSAVAGTANQGAAPAASAPAPAPVAAGTAPASATTGEEEIAFIWPTSGSLLAGFDEARNKGLDLAGKAGDPVLASADGRVVYAGSGLRGYGNLVILKHNNTYLTAYAHNQALLVKEDQTVRKGQKIAEVGNSDADRVKLHFEIRRQGKPVDPAKFLPAR